ncbi:hypothetical protein DLM76_08225 [Leptospira yasudae]|uniref:Uncharacterized protein n=1 Tax=Leptospira yasudae TaxID=2202201 RepID=A0ABX9MAG8_9LEPT|nr:hypothetical protein DLM77_00140 [Leptospira yasudae]RHX95415.1 hypothetical protein DLM76_08225 [Leptospira yasudae]TGK30791.1 hypothetical protein EHQ05_07120 [Leptospira yasudae]TGM04562.1 hypothetical protein EHQ86_11615 [Leptospira yasudae]
MRNGKSVLKSYRILPRRFSNTLQSFHGFYCLSLRSDSIRGNDGIRQRESILPSKFNPRNRS